jgi:DNA-binding transcriptional regulator YdaS (Cro superfamily)
MRLPDYLARNEITQTEFAQALGCSQALVSRWVSGESPPPERCLQIEEVTNHDVLCEDLRPDLPWYILRSYRSGSAAPHKSRLVYHAAQAIKPPPAELAA